MPRRNRVTSNEDRTRIVESYNAGQDFITVAEALGVKRTTAYNIIRNYQRTNRIDAIHGEGCNTIIDNETMDLITMMTGDNPLITLHQMRTDKRQIWSNKPEFLVSILSRYLDGDFIMLKKNKGCSITKKLPRS